MRKPNLGTLQEDPEGHGESWKDRRDLAAGRLTNAFYMKGCVDCRAISPKPTQLITLLALNIHGRRLK